MEICYRQLYSTYEKKQQKVGLKKKSQFVYLPLNMVG